MAENESRTDVIRRLMATPPGEFVAARNQLAKTLRADGDKDTAKAVAALRRPSVADWVFNVLATDEPDAIDGFADAATEVQAAQAAAIEGRAGGDIREAMRALRDRTGALVALARPRLKQPGLPASGSSVGDLTSRLAEIAGSEAATELLRSGLLGAGDPGGADPFEGLELPTRSTARGSGAAKRASTKRATTKAAASEKRRPKAGDREREKKAADDARADERRARVRALADAERAHDRALKALGRVDSEFERVTAALAKAQSAADEAQAKLDAARAQHERAEAKRAEAAEVVAAAEDAVADAQRAVDGDRAS